MIAAEETVDAVEVIVTAAESENHAHQFVAEDVRVQVVEAENVPVLVSEHCREVVTLAELLSEQRAPSGASGKLVCSCQMKGSGDVNCSFDM